MRRKKKKKRGKKRDERRVQLYLRNEQNCIWNQLVIFFLIDNINVWVLYIWDNLGMGCRRVGVSCVYFREGLWHVLFNVVFNEWGCIVMGIGIFLVILC